jgi:hypothetical protein
VSRMKVALSAVLLISGMAVTLVAQNQTQQQNDAERLRVELAERARQEAERRDWEAKIFQIKYANAGELVNALNIFRGDIRHAGGNLVAVRAPKEIMPAIEDSIKRLDVPSVAKNAELTVYVLMASDQGVATALPASLQPVVNQLKTVLSYKNFQLLDTIIARGSDSRQIQLSGVLMVAGSAQPANYNMSGQFRIDDRNEKAPLLRIGGMRFRLNVSTETAGPGSPSNYQDIGVNTDVDIPLGQQVVVGKATYGDKAFILVMSAKFN